MVFSIGDGIIKEGRKPPPGTPDRLTRKRANRTMPKIIVFWILASGALSSSLILALTDNVGDFFNGIVIWVVAAIIVMGVLSALTLLGNALVLNSWRYNVSGCLALSILALAYSVYLVWASLQHGGYSDSITGPYILAVPYAFLAIAGNGVAFFMGVRTNWCIALANRDEEY